MRLQSRTREKIEKKDYSRMVLFFDGALFSSTGYLLLSAMALGVFCPEKEDERMRNDGSVCEWICIAPRGLFYWPESALGVMTG
jgi:hypothetical protein